MFNWKLALLIGILAFVASYNFGDDEMQSDSPFWDKDFSPNKDVEFVKYNFSQTSIAQLNQLIHTYIVEDLFYLNMAYNFDRADVALSGFFKFFRKMSDERRESGMRIMQYINKRGGTIKFRRTMKLPTTRWDNGLTAMEACLYHEKELNKKILKMHVAASINHDAHLINFLEDFYIEPQADLIKSLADQVTRLKNFRTDYNLGEYLFDRDLQ